MRSLSLQELDKLNDLKSYLMCLALYCRAFIRGQRAGLEKLKRSIW